MKPTTFLKATGFLFAIKGAIAATPPLFYTISIKTQTTTVTVACAADAPTHPASSALSAHPVPIVNTNHLSPRKAPDVDPIEPLLQGTDDLLFNQTMQVFQHQRSACLFPSPYSDQNECQFPELDWTSDGCTHAADRPFGFNFAPACNRHDFGYRNYKAQGRFDEITRKRIDDKFLKDMKEVCYGGGWKKRECFGPSLKKDLCKETAEMYYEVVRKWWDDRVEMGTRVWATLGRMAVEEWEIA